MPDATKVGDVYFDLVVRDTMAKQLQAIADRARSATQKQFSDIGKSLGDTMTKGMENASRNFSQTVNGAFSKSVALIQAKIKELGISFDRIGYQLDAMWVKGMRPGDKAFDKLLEQQQKVSDRISAMNDRLAIEIQAQAQKRSAAEKAAYEKEAQAAEKAAARKLAASRRANTTTAPPTVSRSVNTANAVRMESVASGAAQSAEQTRSVWQRALDSVSAKMGKVLGDFSSLWRSIKNGAAKAGSALAGLAKRLLPFQAGVKQTGTGVQSLGVRLRSIVSGALVFNLISAGLTRMVSAMGTALTSSSQMQTALANLKGAAATAAAPIIQILTPALAALANAAATVFSYLSQLISFFTGKSVSAMASAAKGMSGVGSAAAGTAKQVKEATRSVAGFDELEKLSAPQDNSDSGGGGGGASAPALNYDFKGKSPFLDSVLDAIKAGQWEQVGQLVAEKLNGAMASIPWDTIDKTVSGWASNLARTLNGFVSTLNWPLLGKTVANGLNVGLHAVDTFMDTFNFTALGDGLANGLNGAIAALDWASLGRFITDKLRAVFEMLHGFVRSFDFTAFGESLATATMAAINNVNWAQAFGDGTSFIIGALQALTAWVQGIDWAGLGTTIADCLLSIDWAGICLNLVLFLGETIKGLFDTLAAFFTELAQHCGDGFLQGLLQFIAGISSWLKTQFVDPIVNDVKELLGIHSPSTVFAEIGQNLVLGLLEGITSIWERVTAFFTSAFQSIRKGFSDTWDAVRNNTVGTFESVRSAMASVWNGIADAVRGAVNTIIGFMNRLLSGAAAMLNGLIDVLNNFKIDVPDDVPLIGGTQFGFSMSHVSAPQIPMLANGGVIRQPTLAMMGEYAGARNDPEIAAPQSAIQQAVAAANGDVVEAILTVAQQIIEAIRENGGDIIIDDNAIGRAAQRYNQRQSIITGGA